MIKLLRTHPMHLRGTRVSSSSSSGISRRGPAEVLGFRKVLESALGKVPKSLACARRPTSLQKGLLSPLYSVQQHKGISPVFFRPQPHAIEKSTSGSTRVKMKGDFEPLLEEASRAFGVEKDLIHAVIKAESDYNPKAKSESGAVGLMQLLPSTGRELGVKDLDDPRENILAGTHYLAMMLDRYKGNLGLALAAYNWGPGNLERNPARLPDETQKYVQRVLRYLEEMTV